MSHTIEQKRNLILRAKRIQGQVEALVRALDEERDCSEVLQLMRAARGAMNSLMAELLEGHIRNHVLNGRQRPTSQQVSAADEVIDMVKSYLSKPFPQLRGGINERTESSRKSPRAPQFPKQRTPQAGETPELESERGNHEHGLQWLELARIGFVALAAAVWFGVWEPFPRVSIIGITAALIGGYPIFKEAWENIVERKMTMELSMTIALLAALAIGEFFTALVITAFVLAAEVLEGLTVGRGRRAIRDLLDFLPRTVSVRRDGQVVDIPAEQVEIGDSVVAKPGEHIPVDGIVLSGRSFVEEAAITGEAMPVEKLPGEVVYAGTINQSGTLEIGAQKLGRDTSFGRIVEAVERAEKSRAPIQKTADRLAGYLVYFALGAAILTFLITRNVRSTISVVIVAGACGIAAGTPLAILGAIGRAARQGAIVKGGLYLEALAAIDTVLLDKTGTLTFGTPQIREVISNDGFATKEIIAAAAIAERRSEHPLAKAIVARAADLGIPVAEPDSFSYTPGRGIRVAYQGDEILVGSRAFIVDRGVGKSLPVDGHSRGSASEVWVDPARKSAGEYLHC